MYNWSVNEAYLKKYPKKYNLWKLEQLLSYGLDKEKLEKKDDAERKLINSQSLSVAEFRECLEYADPNFRGGLLTAEEHDALTPEVKKALTQNSKKQNELVKEMVNLVKVYCKKYPEEKICKFCNFNHVKYIL